MSTLEDPMAGARNTTVGGVVIDEVPAGRARVKRVIYPPGFRWSTHMAPVTGTDRCQHAHVGFVAQGSLAVEYPDGCVVEYHAPAALVVEPGHDGWVIGDTSAVLIQVDCDTETVARFGMTGAHAH
jgi:quercetin dioxygenase-like cupin family protein